MKLKILLSAVFMFAMSAAVFGQIASRPTADMPTVKQILDKYIQAVGGKEANEKIKNRRMSGTIEMAPMGIKGTFESYAAGPNKLYSKLSIAGFGDIIEVTDGTSWHTVNPLQGNREKKGEELLQAKLSGDFYRSLKLAELYPKMELKGTEMLGDTNTYVITATPAGTQPETFYFDTKTGLLVRNDSVIVTPEGNQPVQIYSEDYRDLDGIKIPFKVRTVTPQVEIILIAEEAAQNTDIKDTLFTKPSR